MSKFGELQAVIWDMDGVLVDSCSFHFSAWHRIFDKYKWIVSDETLRGTFGMTNDQVIQNFCNSPLDHETINAIGSEKDRLFREFISTEARFLPGVQTWLQEFRKNGIKQALASSGSWENINTVLDTLHARQYLDAIVSGEDSASKPAPDVFLLAAKELAASPSRCLVIEDAIAGVQAAKVAGMQCLAVTTTNPPEQLNGADLIVRDLIDLKKQMIKKLFL